MGSSWPVFLCLTIVLMGGAGYATGQALASRWRPTWQLVLYSLLLGGADRFLVYALFDGNLLSGTGYAIDTAIVGAIAAASYQRRMAQNMVSQYPWLYERRGVFGWRERAGGGRP